MVIKITKYGGFCYGDDNIITGSIHTVVLIDGSSVWVNNINGEKIKLLPDEFTVMGDVKRDSKGVFDKIVV